MFFFFCPLKDVMAAGQRREKKMRRGPPLITTTSSSSPSLFFLLSHIPLSLLISPRVARVGRYPGQNLGSTNESLGSFLPWPPACCDKKVGFSRATTLLRAIRFTLPLCGGIFPSSSFPRMQTKPLEDPKALKALRRFSPIKCKEVPALNLVLHLVLSLDAGSRVCLLKMAGEIKKSLRRGSKKCVQREDMQYYGY